MAPLAEFHWRTLSALVNNIKSPNQFLKKLLFSNHHTYETEDVDIHLIEKGREIAPFVKKNGEAIMVGGYTWTQQNVSPTNIRIKRPFTPSALLFDRQPGTVVYATSQDMAKARQEHINRDMQVLSDLITNAEEWLCAMALQGTITYSATDQEVFTITYPKSSAHNITLSTFWNDGTPADVNFHANMLTVKRLLAEEGLSPTDCILGSEASTAFLNLAQNNRVALENRQLIQGTIDFTSQFNDDGVLYLGQADGVRFWEYSRTASLNGTSTPMIRAKYAEFISISPNSERELAFGAIPDMDALEGKVFKSERFSKSWLVKDPSARIVLAHSRPLPITRKPNATVSMKVVSG